MINKYKKEVEPWCQICLRDDGIKINESALHALYDCPKVIEIIGKVAKEFDLVNYENVIRPGKTIINTPFIEDGKPDQTKSEYANVIWCTVLKGILNAREKEQTPVYTILAF